jgi:hypothetical protein
MEKVAAWLRAHPGLTIAAVEWAIFAELERLCGCLDAAFWDAIGNLWLADWKHVADVTGVKKAEWFLQLNLYRYLLEHYYGLIVAKMFVVLVHADRDDYAEIVVPRDDAGVSELLRHRRPTEATLTASPQAAVGVSAAVHDHARSVAFAGRFAPGVLSQLKSQAAERGWKLAGARAVVDVLVTGAVPGNTAVLAHARGGIVVPAADAATVLAAPHPTPSPTSPPMVSPAGPRRPRVRHKRRLADDDVPVGDSAPAVAGPSDWIPSCHVLGSLRDHSRPLSFAQATAVDAAVQDEAHHVVTFLHAITGGDDTLTAHHIVYMVSPGLLCACVCSP